MESETQTQTYREDSGRTFQAANDHYILPADNREFARLDAQHHAIKLTQGDVNYLAPLAELLNTESADGSEKKVLDVGCGSGIWIVEMAAEFPKVSCLGIDLAPNWAGRPEVPSNAKFEQCNAVEGIPYPGNTFDVVHSRLLVSGIRDWKTLMKEMIRVLKPNGIIVSIETSATWPVLPNTKEVKEVLPIEEARARAPGHVLFVEKMGQAAIGHGMDPDCGTITIPALMTDEFGLKDHVKIDYNVPFWEWPKDALLKKAGQSMRHDAEEFPDTLAALIMHGAKLTQEEYNPIKQGFLDCIGKEGCYTAMSYHYNYAVKKSVI